MNLGGLSGVGSGSGRNWNGESAVDMIKVHCKHETFKNY